MEVLLASYDWKFNFSSLDVRFCTPLKWVSLHLSIFLENRTASGPSSRSEMRYMRHGVEYLETAPPERGYMRQQKPGAQIMCAVRSSAIVLPKDSLGRVILEIALALSSLSQCKIL